LLEKEEKEEDSDNEKNEEEIEDEEDDVDEEGKRFSSMTYEEQRLYNIARNLRVMKSLGLANTPPPKKKQKVIVLITQTQTNEYSFFRSLVNAYRETKHHHHQLVSDSFLFYMVHPSQTLSSRAQERIRPD
jgi:hypothetical protein